MIIMLIMILMLILAAKPTLYDDDDSGDDDEDGNETMHVFFLWFKIEVTSIMDMKYRHIRGVWESIPLHARILPLIWN